MLFRKGVKQSMDEKLKKLAQRLAAGWKALDKKKKILITSAAAAVLIVIIVVVSALNTTKYELLCSGLTESEAGQIYSAVSAKSIPVKISGTSIYVEDGMADTVLMQLAEEGLPEGDLTYDIYSSGTNYAETDKDKEVKQLQQTQNRLQDTIETIPGVKQAIVNIAQSDSETYVLETDKTATTASVKLSLKSGTVLTKTQVNGIVQLVAHSVSGLTADNITVADSDGAALNGDVTAEDETSEQLVMKNKYEANVKDKLVSMLGQIYGEGNVNVVVNADIDFNSESTVTNSYTSAVANYITEGGEVTSTGSSVAAGAAGVSGAQPAYANTSGSTTNNYTSKSSKTTSMLVGSVQAAIQKVGGRLNKLTVAVILNSNDKAAAATDTEALKQTIANAAGTSANSISIQQMGFSSVVPIYSSAASAVNGPIINVGTRTLFIIAAAALLFVVLLTLFLVLLRQRKKKREQQMEEELIAAQAEEAEKENIEKKPVIPVKSIEETRAETQSNTYKKEIEDFADQKPELVAQILKNWLKD
jgi:flagellar M-ring protein FliF